MTDSVKSRIQGTIAGVLALRVLGVITREAYILVESGQFSSLEPGRFIAAAAGIVLFMYYVRGRDERWLHISLIAVYAFSVLFLSGEMIFPALRRRSDMPMSLWEYFDHAASVVASLGVVACAGALLGTNRESYVGQATAVNAGKTSLPAAEPEGRSS